jgi:hypothetical protein
LSEVFVEEINPVMRKMGYCSGQKLNFTQSMATATTTTKDQKSDGQ